MAIDMQAAWQQISDRQEIQDCLARYARGVDRGDWALVRSTYHPDAVDHHGDYHGDVDGLMAWLDERFAGVDNSSHFLGNCLIEFLDADHAFVETYFVSRRLRAPSAQEQAELGPRDQICRESWGRYADHFERRDQQWRVARRVVVIEASSSSTAYGGQRPASSTAVWGRRDGGDEIFSSRQALLEKVRQGQPA